MPVMRSLLFVPGNRPDMLDKALGLAPDVYVPDMEDSVPASEKASARDTVPSFLPGLAEAHRLVIPRVNALHSGLMEEDLAAVVGPHTYGVTVGKIGSADDIRSVASILSDVERRENLSAGTIKVVPWIETAMGLVNAYEICSASPRVVAAAFGAEDFTRDMGIQRTEDDAEIVYPRSAICVAARAAGVLALDTPFFRFRDPEGLKKDSLAARAYGFRGKFAIHPSQIDAINESFSPSIEEIEHARRVVQVYEQAGRSGSGATSLDGGVIDAPVVRRARDLLELAEAMSERAQVRDAN